VTDWAATVPVAAPVLAELVSAVTDFLASILPLK